MKRKILGLAAAAALAAMTVSAARADQVFTNQGDQINGTIKSISDGKMTVHSDAMSDVVIPLTHIRTFSTDKPIVVQLEDGTQITSQVAAADAGNVTLVGGNGGAGQQLSVAGIDAINPQALTASVQIGVILTRGNTFTDSLNAGFNLGYTVHSEVFTFTGEYLFGRTKTRNTTVTPVTTTTSTTTDRWDLDAKYQHFFTKKFYGYADVDVTKDRVAQLKLRVVPSVGAGYQIFDKSPFKLGVEGGAAYIYQEFDNATPTQKEMALKFAYHLTYDITPGIQFFNDVTYYPAVQHISAGHFLLNTDIGLHAKLTDKLFSELKVEWDYNSTPANNALKNDERYIASLGYAL